MNLTYYPYDLMTMYGTMMINDMGSYDQCRKLEMSEYALITANISQVQIYLYFGACLPKECNQTDFTAVANTITSTLTGIWQGISAKEDKPALIHPWTVIEMKVRKVDETLSNWKENTRMGFILMVSVVLPLLVIISCVPSIYHIF